MIITLMMVMLIVILLILPTGFAKQIYVNSQGVRAKVLEVDNSAIYSNGIISQGEQNCTVEIMSGEHKGEKMDIDKTFSAGDNAWVILEEHSDGSIAFANMVDHYRIDKELLLIALFALLLIFFSGYTGVRTLLSFAFALLAIWKLIIPLTLRGYSPLLISFIVGTLITVGTLLMVAGLTKKALAAIGGAVACSLITLGLAAAFTRYFGIHGSVMQWSESLIYSGFQNLDLTQVYMAAVYLACSGAILDLAIDISAALEELIVHKPQITRSELIRSGLNIGRSVVGSQTTTLLLAYMGSYLSIMMVYMAQATPFMSILNSKTIAAEILHTFVGCIGLVLVSPATSLICAFIYKGREKISQEKSVPSIGTRQRRIFQWLNR
jgi:uncharacterized membrane protein